MMREDEKGFYQPLTMDEGVRYGVYRRMRFGVPIIWVWHWWRKPTGAVLKFRIGEDYLRWHHARNYGTPFAHGEDDFDTETYDGYYKRRLPWRQWNFGSARCLAARNGHRCEETDE